MRKIAVIIFGPPGGGKGTQASLLAQQLGLIHFDTGKFVESLIYDSGRQREKQVKVARRQFENGGLVAPDFILREISTEVKKIAKAGWGVVFSGSPRTIFEAKGFAPLLTKLYGRKNIFIFELSLPPQASIKRNSARVVCKVCHAPLLTAYYPSKVYKHCPVCAGPFYKRTLDKPAVIKVRLREYKDRTKPVVEFMKKHGYKSHIIDARSAPYRVFQKILGYIK